MSVPTRIISAGIAAMVIASLPSASASAASPSRETDHETFTVPVADCGGSTITGDFVIDQVMTTSGGHTILHLRLRATLSNDTTGAIGRYAETQQDFSSSGREFSAGVFTRLVVPGHGAVRLLAGWAGVSADGQPRFTPHAAGLDDDDALISAVCSALG